MNPRNKSCIWALGALVLFLVPGAFALKFEIPKELQEEVETQREAEAQERDRLLREVYGGESGAAAGAGGAGMAFDTGEAADAAADGSADAGLKPTTDRAGADPAGDFGEEEIPVFQTVAVSGSGEPADTGMIAGQVVDQESTSPVSGVAIIIEGTDIGSITDGNGNYTLGPVPSGSYTLSFVKTGYIEAKVTEFEVAAGETKTFPFALPPRPAEMSDEVFELQDFVVTAAEANDMMMKLDIRMNSDAILNVLSSEDFSKYAASDVGEAIKRVSGVTVQGGQFAVIRGLEERYTSTTLNGTPIPSPDPDKQSVPLDLFSSDIVSNLTITKTFEADLPGNSSGGSIGIWTNVYPEELTIKISAKTGYNTYAQDDFFSVERQATTIDFEQARHEASEDFVITPDNPLVYNGPNAEIAQITNGGRVTPRRDSADQDYSIGLEVGGRKRFDNGREFRGLATFSRKQKYRTAKGTEEKRLAMPALNFRESRGQYSALRYRDGMVRVLRGQDILSSDLSTGNLSYTGGLYDQWISKEEEQTSVLLSGELDIDTQGDFILGGILFSTEIEESVANILYNGRFPGSLGLDDDEILNSRGYVPNFTPISTQFILDASESTGLSASEILNGSLYNTTTIALIERSLEVIQLNGRCLKWKDMGLGISWNLSQSEAEQTDSDVISLTSLVLPNSRIYAEIGNDSGDQFTPFVSYRNIIEEQDFARIDFDYEFELSEDITFSSSAGFAMEDTERDSTLITYDLQFSSSGIVSNNSEEVLQDGLTGTAFASPAPVAAATGMREIDAYYVSGKATVGKWDVVAGVRLEKFLMGTTNSGTTDFFNGDVLVEDPDNPTNPYPVFNSQFLGINEGQPLQPDFDTKIEEDQYLPMLSLSYRPIEGMRATAAFSKTNARPSFKDFTYITSRDPESLDYFIGNPALVTSDVKSYDFRLEYAWGGGDMVSVGAFYKKVSNPVEKTFVRGTDAITEIAYNNPDDAGIRGVEFEIRKNLGFIGPNFMQYFSIGGNVSLIEGEVDILPAMEEIFNGGFQFVDQNGDPEVQGEGHNVYNPSQDPSTPAPVYVAAPYTKRELYQQPEWIANADISFEQADWGTRATLSLFMQSDVLDAAEGFITKENAITPSVYQKSFYELNFTLSQELSRWLEGLKLSLQAKNLTNSSRSMVYGDDFGGGTRNDLKVGTTYAIGLSCEF